MNEEKGMTLLDAQVKAKTVLDPNPTFTTQACERVKRSLEQQGLSQADWARKNGFKYHEVVRLLNGFAKGRRGRSHQLAVALGLKREGV